MQETDLLKKIASGDVQAFKTLFESYQPSVFNLCYRFAKNRQEAEDLCQEVFFKIYLAAKTFRQQSKISTWIYRITINLCLNYKRRLNKLSFFSISDRTDERKSLKESLVLAEENQPDHLVELKEKEKIVQAAINSLPKNQRTALILQRYENMSLQEIAQVMNSSVSSIQSRLARAKENLCQRLLPYLKNF